MATRLANREQYAALSGLVQHWDRRWRWRQAVLWLPFSLVPGLVLGILLMLVSRVRPWLLKDDVLVVTLALAAAGALVMLGLVWFWPRSQVISAQRFDILFDLQERVSTALELIEGRIRANDELAEYQLADALNTARAVPYRKVLPFVWRWYGWAALGLMCLAFVILMLLPNPQAEAIQQASAQNAVIDEAAEDLKEVAEDVATDASLDDAQREELLETLQTSINTLEESQISPEEAFATLSETESTLKDEAATLQNQLETAEGALEDATNILNQQPLSDTPPGEEEPFESGFSQTVEEMAQNLEEQSGTSTGEPTQSSMEQTAQMLEQAAQTLAETNPELSQALQEAADALRNGDMEAAQQALEEAAQMAQQSEQNMAQQDAAAEMMQQAAQQAGQQAQMLAQMSQGQEQGMPTQSENGQPGDSGDQSGQPNSQTSSSNPAASNDQIGQLMQGDAPGNQPGKEEIPSGSSNTGAGDTSAPPSDTSSGAQNTGEQISQDNAPDGTGVGEYEAVFAPRRLGIAGDETITLEPDPGDTAVKEGQLSENPSGNATVPYNQVFSDYRNAVNAALDSDYIPLGLRDVVHDYFTSLDPQP